MIHLSTGTPGSGKTLNLIDLVEHECKGRDIYYRGIKELTVGWTEISDEEVHNWFNYPAGSVFVIDECQQVWPKIPHTKKSPESVDRLDTHRHGGYDFYIVTQATRLINKDIESFIDRHYHYQRSSGLSYTKRYQWESFCKDVSSSTAKKDAQVSRIPFNKKTFSKYKSAEIHTSRMRIPKPLIVLALCVIAFIALAVSMYNRHAEVPPEPIVTSADNYQAPMEHGADLKIPDVPYEEQFLPRITDVPLSAPAYDEVTKVKTFPRPQCMRNERTKVCKCFTQQATSVAISERMCNDMVDNGWFNPYQEEVVAAAPPAQPEAAPDSTDHARESAPVYHIGRDPSELPRISGDDDS